MLHSVSDLVRAPALLPPGAPGTLAFHRLFEVREEAGRALPPPPLAAKYGVEADCAQCVVVVTNRATRQAAFFNSARRSKPQTFAAARQAGVAGDDPTVGKGCDFCSPLELTAADAFGRFENEHAISASNLFKISGVHGLVLFKHHNPLRFTQPQLGGAPPSHVQLCAAQLARPTGQAQGRCGARQPRGLTDAKPFPAGLLSCAADWLAGAAAAHPGWQHPALMWNCGGRAGASQYHGHAQVPAPDSPGFSQGFPQGFPPGIYAPCFPLRR